MNARLDRSVRAVAAMLAALLVAGAAAAGANDGFLPPLPGADAGEAAEDARAARDPAAGSDAEADETKASATGEAASDSPASGSRLLRVLAERREGSVPADSGAPGAAALSGPRVSGTSVHAAEGCPRALLRRLLAGAVDEADALTALAIEREALVLCRERQEIVAGLFETEARLAELRAPVDAPVPAPPVEPTALPAPPAAVPAATAPVSPLRAALAETAEAAKEEEPPPSYAWFSIIGTAGALRAGITDGEGVWFVRVGDPLPDGGTVAAISGRPPGVRLALPGGGAEETLVPETLVPGTLVPETPLPFRARPGGGP